MKNILLVCGAGMSTSLLVRKMQEADINHEYHIRCSDTLSAHLLLLETDIFLLAPHIAYMKDEYLHKCLELNIPFLIIDGVDYRKMDGESVLRKTQQELEKYSKENPFQVVLVHSRVGAMSDLIALDMKKKLQSDEKDWQIKSLAIDDFDNQEAHIVLLEPQIGFEKKNVERILHNPFTIVDVPAMSLYASFDGRKMLDYIHQIYDQKLEEKKKELKERIDEKI